MPTPYKRALVPQAEAAERCHPSREECDLLAYCDPVTPAHRTEATAELLGQQVHAWSTDAEAGKLLQSQVHAFDLVVTVALGSTLATILLSKDVALAEGMVAFALLIFPQYAVTWTSVRSRRFEKWIKSEPRLLFHDGTFLEDSMRRERVTRDEVLAAIRQEGCDHPAAVRSVVLETDSSMSVIAAGEARSTG